MTYEEWKKVVDGDGDFMKWQTERDSARVKTVIDKSGSENYNGIRTKEELQSVTQNVRESISDYADNESKWSGKIRVDNLLSLDGVAGQKEWNCDITLIDSVDDGTVWHEMLHSCSVSHYDAKMYVDNQRIEEASVEFLKQQICKEKLISSSSAYEDLTIVLQVLNDRFNFGTDMKFAKTLFNIPLPKRYEWLENLVDDILRKENASFEDYNDVMA